VGAELEARGEAVFEDGEGGVAVGLLADAAAFGAGEVEADAVAGSDEGEDLVVVGADGGVDIFGRCGVDVAAAFAVVAHAAVGSASAALLDDVPAGGKSAGRWVWCGLEGRALAPRRGRHPRGCRSRWVRYAQPRSFLC
jgi:hypothetical protein